MLFSRTMDKTVINSDQDLRPLIITDKNHKYFDNNKKIKYNNNKDNNSYNSKNERREHLKC